MPHPSTSIIHSPHNPHFYQMGCCGDDENDDVQSQSQSQPLNPTPPFNSNFMPLTCIDTLRLIFEKLSVDDVARARCVSQTWNKVGADGEIVRKAFMGAWKLKQVVGTPASGSFWRENNGISKFAISHKICRRDSVAGLAVKYSVQVMDIKRLNNMMSDHGIYSRERLLIPISNPDILVNATCYIEMDNYAKREVAVLYLDGEPDKKLGRISSKVTSEEGRRRLIDSLKRSMQVDDGTAQYYLSISNGNLRAALTQFSEDMSWERQTGRS